MNTADFFLIMAAIYTSHDMPKLARLISGGLFAVSACLVKWAL